MRIVIIALVALLALGCASEEGAPSTSSGYDDNKRMRDLGQAKEPAPAAEDPKEPTTAAKETPISELLNMDGSRDKGLPMTAGWGAKAPKKGDPVAILTTSKGRIVLRFFPEKAPRHVENFLKLAREGFYDGTKFHRVIPGFMIQGGDPNTKKTDVSTWGQGGPGTNVNQEFNDMPHKAGILSMARTQDPNGAGSQFFIVHKDSHFLDRQYTVFGHTLEGMDVVEKIVTTPTEPGDRPAVDVVLTKVEIKNWPIDLAN